MSTNFKKMIDGSWTAKTMRSLAIGLALVSMAMAASVQPVAARGAPDSFADLAERLSPAVVNISTVQNLPERTNRRLPQLPEGMPFGDLWDQFRGGQQDEDEQPRQARSLGSGFIIDPKGIVITNNHVVEEADEITVIMVDGTEYVAEVLGKDALSDVAVLKIETENGDELPYVKWGDSDNDRIGDWVIAIGNPFGLGGSVTAGIISARNRAINSGDIEFIQTDAPINRGNSGGPLFNMEGNVIGVNSAIFSPSGGNVGIGFAIPSNDAERVIADLQKYGKVRRGWLGVGIQPMTEEIAESLGVDFQKGAIVTRVEENSPAASGGMQEGDIIITWDGKPVEDSHSLSRLVKRTDIDKEVPVVIVRAGARQTLQVKTGEFKDSMLQQGEPGKGGKSPSEARPDRKLVQGMELAPLNETLRRRFNVDDEVEGVAVLQVSRRSPAYRAGIRPGTVILRVNQQEVTHPTDVVGLIDAARNEKRERILVLVTYRGNTVHIPLKLMDQKEEEEAGKE